MITDVSDLIRLCSEELADRQYKNDYGNQIKAHWKNFSLWMKEKHYEVFSESLANQYCDQMIGTHLIIKNMSESSRLLLRSIRMLVSYQKNGEFEFRSPRKEYIFTGETGNLIENFLSYSADILLKASSTIDTYKIALLKFCDFLDDRNLKIEDLSIDLLQEYFNSCCSSVSVRHIYANGLRQFFRYLYANKYTNMDLSVYVLPDNYNRHSSIPTTYTEEEIRSVINGPDRGSAIGKRDYLILLLAAEYGWRSGDITHFRLDQIDWENNKIRFEQNKTGNPVEYPLLSSVGNAIIDYLKNGRPDSDLPEVILSVESSRHSKPLHTTTIHSIVSCYMKKANITGWKEKKHGPHSLRFSLASNLLKKNVSLPVISTVLGHQNTETTKIYLKVDTENLKTCCLPMPKLSSPHYQNGGN